MKARYCWGVIARRGGGSTYKGFPIKTQEKFAPLAIYLTKEAAIQARRDRYVFTNQMELETTIRRVRIY